MTYELSYEVAYPWREVLVLRDFRKLSLNERVVEVSFREMTKIFTEILVRRRTSFLCQLLFVFRFSHFIPSSLLVREIGTEGTRYWSPSY